MSDRIELVSCSLQGIISSDLSRTSSPTLHHIAHESEHLLTRIIATPFFQKAAQKYTDSFESAEAQISVFKGRVKILTAAGSQIEISSKGQVGIEADEFSRLTAAVATLARQMLAEEKPPASALETLPKPPSARHPVAQTLLASALGAAIGSTAIMPEVLSTQEAPLAAPLNQTAPARPQVAAQQEPTQTDEIPEESLLEESEAGPTYLPSEALIAGRSPVFPLFEEIETATGELVPPGWLQDELALARSAIATEPMPNAEAEMGPIEQPSEEVIAGKPGFSKFMQGLKRNYTKKTTRFSPKTNRFTYGPAHLPPENVIAGRLSEPKEPAMPSFEDRAELFPFAYADAGKMSGDRFWTNRSISLLPTAYAAEQSEEKELTSFATSTITLIFLTLLGCYNLRKRSRKVM